MRLINRVILLCAAAALAACAPKTALNAVKKAGKLKVGISFDDPGFGSFNPATEAHDGLEVEIARLLAKEIIGDGSAVSFKHVTAKTRGPLLDSGKLDLVIARFTVTEERMFSYNFSIPYYVSATSIMVKKDSGILQLEDLNEKRIGIVISSSALNTLGTEAQAVNITPQIVEFTEYAEVANALNAGIIDAFFEDSAVLKMFRNETMTILPEEFAPESYAAATKLSSKDLAAAIDAAIRRALDDGTIAALIQRFNL